MVLPSAYGPALPAFAAAKSLRRKTANHPDTKVHEDVSWTCVLLHLQQFHVEDQVRIGRDWPTRRSIGPVTKRRRNAQLTFPANLHSRYSFFPSLDDLAVADREIKRLAGID